MQGVILTKEVAFRRMRVMMLTQHQPSFAVLQNTAAAAQPRSFGAGDNLIVREDA